MTNARRAERMAHGDLHAGRIDRELAVEIEGSVLQQSYALARPAETDDLDIVRLLYSERIVQLDHIVLVGLGQRHFADAACQLGVEAYASGKGHLADSRRSRDA